jgi:hypothetical protein
MPIVRCPHCDEADEVPTRDLGTSIECHACGTGFRAKRSQHDEDEDVDQPRRRRTSMSQQRDEEKKTNRTVFWIVACILVVLGLPCLGCVGFIIYTNTAKVNLSAPWTDHSLLDRDDRVLAIANFPRNPVNEPITSYLINANGSVLTFSSIGQGTDGLLDAVTLIGYADFQEVSTDVFDQEYQQLIYSVQKVIVDNPFHNSSPPVDRRGTYGGYPMKEATFTAEDGSYIVRVIHLTDHPKKTGARLLIVVAGGSALNISDRDKFLQSVRIGNAK